MPDISKLLSAESVAIVGASPDATRIRGILFDVITRPGYEGRIYPVTPSHKEIAGHTCYPTVDDLPEAVDLAVLLVPAEVVAAELERCGKAGIKAAAIIASGFAEQVGEEGDAMQRKLSEVIAKYDMAVTGPNALGFVNLAKSFLPTFSPAISRPALPLLPEWHTEGGRVAIIAQSGAIGFGMFDRGRLREIPFRYVVTTGNEAGLRAFDLVEYMLEEDETDLFCMFLEDIRDGEQFRRVAARALKENKQLIVAKIGRSQAAQESAASHTGAMAGSDRVNRAVLEEYGVILCDDLDQLVDTAAAFYHNRNKLPQGRRIAISAGTGGGGGWMADMCDGLNLEIPVLDAAAREKIDAVLPPYGSSRNPVDGTAQAITSVGYAELLNLTASANNIDGCIMVTSARNAHHFTKEKDKFFTIGRDGSKPVVAWTYTWPSQDTIAFFAAAGVPLYTATRSAANGMAELANYSEARDAFNAPLQAADCGTSDLQADREKVQKANFEFAARQLLAEHGIGRLDGHLVQDGKAAAAAAGTIDGRVVMKIQSSDILHKTEANGVILNVSGGEAAADSYAALIQSAQAYDPNADIKGVLVEPMADAGTEMILGVQNDATFGPMILVGMGGIFTEIMEDTVLASPVATKQAATALIHRLKGAPLLTGARGKLPADIDAVADLIVALSKFAVRYADAVSTIDLNPVIVHPAGEGLSVVDALIEASPTS
ncbi:MAG: acetate--CoA ligase family protein [Hyphomicrobiaceae bacterium]